MINQIQEDHIEETLVAVVGLIEAIVDHINLSSKIRHLSQSNLLNLYTITNNQPKEESKHPKMQKNKSRQSYEDSKFEGKLKNKSHSNFQSKG